MKLFLRAIIKLLGTPFFLIFISLMLLTGSMMKFLNWVYEADKFTRDTTNETHQQFKDMFVKWFTKI